MAGEKRRCRKPFQDYWSPGPTMELGDGRLKVSLIPLAGTKKKPRIMSYARYLYMTSTGVLLSATIHVDHIDGDRTNDTIGNLQALTPRENSVKSVMERRCFGTLAEMVCPDCLGLFYREKRQTHMAKKGEFTACSRKCAGRFRKKLQDARLVCNPARLAELSAAMSGNFVQWLENKNPRGVLLVEPKHVHEPWESVSDPL